MSAQQAADALGLHRNTIYGLEKGDDGATLRMMTRVADLYGVTLGYIFRDENASERVPIEFQPLLEPLRPLDQQARESIIRNVASNLRFMSTLYSSAVGTVLGTAANVSSYPAPSQENRSTDEVGDVLPDTAANDNGDPAPNGTTGRRHERQAQKGRKH